jgi:cellulose synthase/poly-beta-1,6-N-acetylglucosamine synthase-like glycosyltransferase
MATVLFWVAIGLTGYAYVGYLAVVWALGRLFAKPVRQRPTTPTVTVLLAVHNEETRIGRKIENCLALDYPPDRLSLVVVSDGSTDRTLAIVREYVARFPGRVHLVTVPTRRGKAHALNVGTELAGGEILLLADVRQELEPGVARMLSRNFADPAVGAVSGELVLLEATAPGPARGLGLYWHYEKTIRQAESRFASCIGYTGAISAIRRSLVSPLPEHTLLDDLVAPLRVIARGYRVVFEPAARAVDWVSDASGHEFARKVRTLAGVLQTFAQLGALVGPMGPVTWWQFVSHKLLRLVVPYALVVALLANLALDGPVYRALLAGQLLVYGAGILGLLVRHPAFRWRIPAAAATFLMLNGAAVLGALFYLSGRQLDLWRVTPHRVAQPDPT